MLTPEELSLGNCYLGENDSPTTFRPQDGHDYTLAGSYPRYARGYTPRRSYEPYPRPPASSTYGHHPPKFSSSWEPYPISDNYASSSVPNLFQGLGPQLPTPECSEMPAEWLDIIMPTQDTDDFGHFVDLLEASARVDHLDTTSGVSGTAANPSDALPFHLHGSPTSMPRNDIPSPSPSIASTSKRHPSYDDFETQSFPLNNEDHNTMREALRTVMRSHWKWKNEIEPNDAVLLQFMVHDDIDNRWYCLFWKGGKPCDCSCKKKYHARGHIRSHIDLLPYVCHQKWYVDPYAHAGLLYSPTSSVLSVKMGARGDIPPLNLF